MYSKNGKPSSLYLLAQWEAVVAFYGRSTILPRVGRRITSFLRAKEVQMQQLKIIFDGTPDVSALPASEQKVFFSTLLERIIMLKQQDN